MQWSRPRMVAVAALVVLATGCGGARDAATRPDCPAGKLGTLHPGMFTFATDQPAHPPWFVDDQPANGEGFESAVAYAVADRLGYPRERVGWARVPFTTAMAPGPKPFDAAISQFSITDQRREIVDFSAPYYDVAQAVVAVAGSPAAGVSTVAELSRLHLGAATGTTSALAARSLSHTPITVYDSNEEAVTALAAGQVDALVMDLPSAQRTGQDLRGGVIVGQLPTAPERTEQLALLLDQDSPLTGCVTEAVDALRGDGTLDRLRARWMPGTVVPVLGGGQPA